MKVEIDYPCSWSYRIIGADVQSLESAVSEILGERKYTIVPSNSSSGGKYHALKLSLTVLNEDERLFIFQQLKENDAIKFVL
jgi:putative lipoic acid-binding regulatory protein